MEAVCTNQGEAARHGREPRHADGRTPGKSEDNGEGGSQVPLARNAPRRQKVRAELRELHEIQVQPAASSRKNADTGADFVGPLHGNSMLLVLVDRFSKWTEIVPLRRATTETLRKAVRERIVARYGVPKIMITDNGVQFTSRAFKRFLEELGVKHQLTAPYTPQENPTETTGYSPAFITQGREPRLPNTLFDEQTAGTGRCPQTPVENAEKLKEIFELVRRNIEKAVQDQARHYNLRRRPWKPKVGETVWAKEHHLSKAAEGFAAKLAPRFDGPFKIKKFTSPVICIVEHATTRKTKTAHISDLKPGSAGAGRPEDNESDNQQ
ncbi:uncharacterized protein LOC122756640 [Drosophila santomea]|uniref:uncharacterized protein LOC122756475 n=1 Tax=Drosophila santomea TaxID=129105 RepID=UPI001CCF6BB5|nr:uncharacterized protein LOC122756475 [Drosophila santomea]XP_043862790.1 uncharacterized protein LOC122756640 [Drosophila santomea]